MFINHPSIIILRATALIFTLAITSKQRYFLVIRRLLGGTEKYKLTQLKPVKHLFKATANIALLVALVTVFIDVIGLVYKKREYPLA